MPKASSLERRWPIAGRCSFRYRLIRRAYDPATGEAHRTLGKRTGELRCERVSVGEEFLVAGPAENVMAGKIGGKTGGLQTSALALGLSSAALDFLAREAEKRADFREPLASLRDELDEAHADLLALAAGDSSCTSESIRTQANSFVLRATQSALAAAKGTGYVVGHPTGRWCREALFFLVWSCPQPVMAANLCELAGLEIRSRPDLQV